jgi:hypothetical protein
MKNILIALSILLACSSCKNLVPYSDALKTKYSISNEQLKKIQFYTSAPIVLQRKLTGESGTEIYAGQVKVVHGERVEEVLIPSGTAGILVKDDEGKMEISFERDDTHYLRFGSNPTRNMQYALLASDWRNKVGTVMYAGNKYYTSPESVEAVLNIDLRKIMKSETNSRIAKGRKVN